MTAPNSTVSDERLAQLIDSARRLEIEEYLSAFTELQSLRSLSTGTDAGVRVKGGHGIYIASKVKHAERWRDLRDFEHDPIISTWIDEAGAGESASLEDLWRRCVHEASNAGALIIYCEPGEILKGAWVELGAALANGVPIFAVGIEGFTVANHAGIKHCSSIIEARRLALSALEQQPAASQEPPTGKERLHVAQNATTPVAWLGTNLDGESEPFLTKRQAEFWSSGACHVEPLYTHPSPTQDKASPGMEVVAWKLPVTHEVFGHTGWAFYCRETDPAEWEPGEYDKHMASKEGAIPLIRQSEAASLLRTQAEEIQHCGAALAKEVEDRLHAEAQLSTAQATIERYREALEAFVNVRDQYPESVKLINKTIPGFSLVAVHVTKDQFLAARSVLEGKECS